MEKREKARFLVDIREGGTLTALLFDSWFLPETVSDEVWCK